MTPNPDLLTRTEAAAYLRCSQRRFRNLIKLGYGPARLPANTRPIMFYRPTLDAWARDAANFIYPSNERGEWVYFAHCLGTNRIKIGWTGDRPEQRMYRLQGSAQVKLVLAIAGGLTRERELHDLFFAWRVHGEWFAPCAPLLAFIREGRTAWIPDPHTRAPR